MAGSPDIAGDGRGDYVAAGSDSDDFSKKRWHSSAHWLLLRLLISTSNAANFDLGGRGTIDGADLGQLLAVWGDCSSGCDAALVPQRFASDKAGSPKWGPRC